MKGQFQNVQQLGAYIAKEEYTKKPGDEMNITQANTVAKELIRLVGAIGGRDAVANLRNRLYDGHYRIGKTELTKAQMERLVIIAEGLFSWEWKLFFPWSKAWRNSRNLKALCRQYGYLDQH